MIKSNLIQHGFLFFYCTNENIIPCDLNDRPLFSWLPHGLSGACLGCKLTATLPDSSAVRVVAGKRSGKCCQIWFCLKISWAADVTVI